MSAITEVTESERAILKRGQCPDCFARNWKEGPHGGEAVNWKCATPTCGSEFNIGPGVFFAERISEPRPLAPKSLATDPRSTVRNACWIELRDLSERWAWEALADANFNLFATHASAWSQFNAQTLEPLGSPFMELIAIAGQKVKLPEYLDKLRKGMAGYTGVD